MKTHYLGPDGTKLKQTWTNGVASFFSPGGKTGQDIFQGGQDSQKDHFVQENVHFFLILLKVGGKLEGQDILLGEISP